MIGFGLVLMLNNVVCQFFYYKNVLCLFHTRLCIVFKFRVNGSAQPTSIPICKIEYGCTIHVYFFLGFQHCIQRLLYGKTTNS
jgi:hypothetical protein